VPPPESEPDDPNERFRERRAQARRRRRFHRKGALAVLLIAAAAVVLGATVIGTRHHQSSTAHGKRAKTKSEPTLPRPLPAEVRGVHVTMALASLPGKLDAYMQIPGLNTIELDVKDEYGKVGFLLPVGTLARRIGAAQPYYRARRVAGKAHAAGVYLIGRVVVFEDPVLTEQRPELAILLGDGSVWRNDAGLGWANPYDERVWDYNLSIAKAAARAGFDEIQFDYVRFPSDGPIEEAVFPGKTPEPQGRTITRFVQRASTELKPLRVRVSVDVFGLSATHDLGIGQVPRRLSRYVDAVYPMVYASHYRSGEFNLADPGAVPGRTVARSLRDFRRALRGRHAMLIPWLEDFSLTSEPRPPVEVRAQIQAARRYHARGFLLWNPKGIYTAEVLK
jgi:hypothetical protein